MKTKLLLSILLLAIAMNVKAQQTFDTSREKENMAKLDVMKGNWEGSGWASSPDGSRHEFTQSEIVEEKLDGTAILVQGLGKRMGTEEIIHDALAIITYNKADSTYLFRSYLSTGQSTSASGYFDGDLFIWGFEVPGGEVKYTITFEGEDKWNEIGEFSRDGSQWYKFIEMNLEKISNN